MTTYTDSQLYDLYHSSYIYSDGQLISKRTGSPVVGIDGGGYIVCQSHRRTMKVHRVIFLMHHGYLPDVVDHINRIKDDNRIENLRAANRAQNAQNSGVQTNNKLGVLGVSLAYIIKSGPRAGLPAYRAKIQTNGVEHILGHFATIEEASTAYQVAAKELFGDFASL